MNWFQYTLYPSNANVVIESLDNDLCSVNDGKILAKNVGICPVRYTVDNVKTLQFIVIEKTNIFKITPTNT